MFNKGGKSIRECLTGPDTLFRERLYMLQLGNTTQLLFAMQPQVLYDVNKNTSSLCTDFRLVFTFGNLKILLS